MDWKDHMSTTAHEKEGKKRRGQSVLSLELNVNPKEKLLVDNRNCIYKPKEKITWDNMFHELFDVLPALTFSTA